MALTDTCGNRLPRLATHANAFVEGHIIADASNSRQYARPISDQRGALDRLGNLAVPDPVGLGAGKDELSAGDIDLPAVEALGVNAILDPRDELIRIVLPAEHERIGHSRHGRVSIAFAAAIARRIDAH